MFKWINKNSNQEAPLLPQDKMRMQYVIEKIKTLVGVTQADFQKLYLIAIQRFTEYKRTSNLAADESLIINTLEQVILALKKRRGYLLPLGADSETSFRESEEWTYAVFIASLLKEINPIIRFDIAKALIPAEGFAWLHRNKALFSLWESYLSGNNSNTIFGDIVGKIEPIENVQKINISETNLPPLSVTSTILETDKKEENLEPSQEITNASNTEKNKLTSKEVKKILPKGIPIQEIDLYVEQKIIENGLFSDSDNTKNFIQKNDDISERSILPEASAEDFFDWLKVVITHNAIQVNKPESFIHRVSDGLFILIPQAIEHFLKEKEKLFDVSEKPSALNKVMTLTKKIKKHESLIRNAQGSRIHSYCLGKWEDRQVLSGIIVKVNTIFDDIFELPVNSQLSIDPYRNYRSFITIN